MVCKAGLTVRPALAGSPVGYFESTDVHELLLLDDGDWGLQRGLRELGDLLRDLVT